jgi:immunoglobulin-binding protein 1
MISQVLHGMSLGQLFSTGQAILTELEDSSLSSIDPVYQAKVNDAIRRLIRADDLVAQLNIFSDNEIIDDINTNDLKFLLTTAYLGDLTLKISGKDIDRSKILEKSRVKIHSSVNKSVEYSTFFCFIGIYTTFP